MSIFGITLTQSDLWLLTICGAIISLWIGTRIVVHINTNHAARLAYRKAFADAVLNITENPTCTLATIAYECHDNIIAAISNYRPHVPFWRSKAFERAVAHYKEAYDIAMEYGDPFAFALSEKTDNAREKRKYYRDAINLLLSFA